MSDDNTVVCESCHRIYRGSKCPECGDTRTFKVDNDPVEWFQCKDQQTTYTSSEESMRGGRRSAIIQVPDQKKDEGKPAVGQMKSDFPRALLMLAKLTSYGIKEGKPAGEWKNIPNALARFENAHGRHDLEMHLRERDKESMFLHAAHRAWDAMAVLELILIEEEND